MVFFHFKLTIFGRFSIVDGFSIIGGFSIIDESQLHHFCVGFPAIVECQRVPLLFFTVVLLREDIPNHRSWSENTERGRGGAAVPQALQVTGAMGPKLL